MPDTVLVPPDHAAPAVFTRAQLEWLPWLAPLAVDAAIAEAAARGPYGHYPGGPLCRENTDGPTYRPSASTRGALGPRLTAAFEHVHLLVFHPRDAQPAALQALLDAGWSTTAVVTLSQITAFLSFQVRVLAGLRTLAGRT